MQKEVHEKLVTVLTPLSAAELRLFWECRPDMGKEYNEMMDEIGAQFAEAISMVELVEAIMPSPPSVADGE